MRGEKGKRVFDVAPLNFPRRRSEFPSTDIWPSMRDAKTSQLKALAMRLGQGVCVAPHTCAAVVTQSLDTRPTNGKICETPTRKGLLAGPG